MVVGRHTQVGQGSRLSRAITNLAHGCQALHGFFEARHGVGRWFGFNDGCGLNSTPDQPQVEAQFLQTLALWPARPETGFLDGGMIVCGPDQQQVCLHLGALLDGLTAGEQPEAL
jgi:hypothetical protein